MTTAELTNLRRAYADICRGYSQTEWEGQTIYVKHLNVFDQTEVDLFYEETLAKVISGGLYTEQTRLQMLELNGMWTKKDERALIEQRGFVTQLTKTRSGLSFKVQIDAINKQINEERAKLNALSSKRAKLLGTTAERVAENQLQYEYVRLALYSDRELTKPLFSAQDMHNLDDEQSESALIAYINCIQRFDNRTIRAISVQPFFTNSFYLCKDDIQAFFGKPLVSLSIYQTNLLSNGQYFRSILTNNDVPADMIQDPDRLEDFVTRSHNIKKVVDKASVSKGGRVGLVGAGKEDFAVLNVKDSTQEMQNVASKQYKSGADGARDLGFTYIN